MPARRKAEAEWREKTYDPAVKRFGERKEFASTSGYPIEPLYGPDGEANGGYDEDVGYPGQYPYTRASSPRCTGAGSGRCASTPASPPPRSRTGATATCSNRGRRA